VTPEAGVHVLTADEAKAAPAHGLLDEIRNRVAAGPVAFHLTVQVAEPGDVTSDPTVAWPADRRVVDLGRIVVTKAVADNAAAEKKIAFLPNKTVPGWGPSDDPFLSTRTAVYGVAYPKRQ
jgi:catalase